MQLEFKLLANPAEHNYFAMCPTLGQPILSAFVDEDGNPLCVCVAVRCGSKCLPDAPADSLAGD